MNTKKIPRELLLYLLTFGASLIIGLLSFSGMFALWPIIPLAVGSLVLAVGYEGEIYLQNIRGAFNKLFKYHALERQISNPYLLSLLNNIQDHPEITDYPLFFKDYALQIKLVHGFEHEHGDGQKPSTIIKKRAQKKLRDMEKWFATQLFIQEAPAQRTAYEEALHTWLTGHNLDIQQRLLAERRTAFYWIQAFSALAGGFMFLGTTYLLMEAITTIPFIAALPFATSPLFIVPMAMVAGAAYGLLTYNSFTDLVSNNTLAQWKERLQKDFANHGWTAKNIFMGSTATLLMLLAIGLTVCTAGTWWTVAQETPAALAWIGKMPRFVMGVINPAINLVSSIVFNLQNSSESLEIIYNLDPIETQRSIKTQINDALKELWAKENWFQLLNPFRVLLMITVTPLRIVLFLGHLISIGVTSDRVPGMPQVLSALLGIISEGFEDFHYFSGHDHHHHHHGEHEGHEGHDHAAETDKEHMKSLFQERLQGEHGHNHGLDLPTLALKTIASPVYALATLWDWIGSQGNSKQHRLSFWHAVYKQSGFDIDGWVQPSEQPTLDKPRATEEQPSADWTLHQALLRIKGHQRKVLKGHHGDQDKLQELDTVISQLKLADSKDIPRLLSDLHNGKAFKQHGFFADQTTESFLKQLPTEIGLRAG